jgi:hypothetical protein
MPPPSSRDHRTDCRIQSQLRCAETELGRGEGFAFGAEALFAPPELRFLIFYASIRFLVGFDVALLNYGASAQCADGRAMGANGWYATGQMYARLDASVGLYR